MEFDFASDELVELYTTGKSRKLRSVDKKVAKKFVERVNRIQDAETIYDLREPPSMCFESLEGHEARFSIRVTIKWRLEFEIDFTDEERTTGTVLIVALSQHYH